MGKTKGFVVASGLVIVSVIVCLGLAEGALRLKNSAMNNYDIEMWRYGKTLKMRTGDAELPIDHVKSSSAVLQNVTIRINSYGLRGGPVTPLPSGERRILVLGNSIALGWGVPEEDTLEAQLQTMLAAHGAPAQVLNGGMGNCDAQQYVARFFKNFATLSPTDIVVLYNMRDAEVVVPGAENPVLRYSELAVTLWTAYQRLFHKGGMNVLVDHYRDVNRVDAPGFIAMKRSLAKLAQYAKAHGARIFLAMAPETHDLVDYPFAYAHELMGRVAAEEGYTYIDLLPAMRNIPPDKIFVMPGDPHPNRLGHELMAREILPALLAADGSDRKS